ncbi:MAG TPA: hypothetical protein VFS00_06815 [Polyangiaceae bacterium]|nr:hypothetical protein [Polyangiaceae bacterium]
MGNVGSVAFRESYSKNGFAQPYDSPDLMLLVGEEGRLFARPTTPLAAGQASSITGLLQLPETRSRAASFVCAGPGSRLTLDPKGNVPWSARLSSLSKLGACPGGTPVAGEVAITLGDGRQPSGMTSTIEGAPFAAPVGDVAVSSNADNSAVTAEVFSLSPMGSVVFSFERAGTAPLAEGAFLIVPEGGPDAGAVYCAGAGSTVRTGGSGSDFFLESVSLQGLTRLGTCQGAAAEGELYLCGG